MTEGVGLVFSDAIIARSAHLIDVLRTRGLRLATAESCTGGLIGATLTEVAGASDVFEGGLVTYSNAAKTRLLGVPQALLAAHGAVSREVAEAMARGALERLESDMAVAVTGIAGPGGASEAKPVGLVHVAGIRRDAPVVHRECRFGDLGRHAVRLATVEAAFALAESLLHSP